MGEEENQTPVAGESETEPYDYSLDWSDYDSWGFDKRQDVQKKSLESAAPGEHISSKSVYEQRRRRRLGSAKRADEGH